MRESVEKVEGRTVSEMNRGGIKAKKEEKDQGKDAERERRPDIMVLQYMMDVLHQYATSTAS